MPTSLSQKPVAIIGAGIAGLTAAHFLKRNGIPVMLFEAGKQVGGMASSYVDDEGFSYDFGAHFITNRLAAAVGISASCIDVRYYGESVWHGGQSYSYPFGLMRKPRFAIGALLTKLRRRGPIETAADWFTASYGEPLAKEVALPLLEEWSGLPASELAPSVGMKMQNSIPWTMFLKLAARHKDLAVSCGYSHEMPEHPTVWHVYPKRGLGMLCERIYREVADSVRLESTVESIVVDSGRVVAVKVNGKLLEVSAAVSTAPCPVLAKIVHGTNLLHPLAELTYRAMVFVNLRFERRGLLTDTVVWTPEKEFPFFRLSETTRSMPWLAPEGKTMLTADIGCQVGDTHWRMDDEALGELCVDAIEAIAPGVRASYRGCRVLRTPFAYPVYAKRYEDLRQRLELGTGIEGLWSIGRNGEFGHLLMEDVYWRTLKKMRALTSSLEAGSQHSLQQLRQKAA